jgi:pimeloyl-ACP methyl ester carboxylesterase
LCAAFAVPGCWRKEFALAENRPATEEAIHFSSGQITLAGTLVLPHASQRIPAVVLFHGSGPQERDLSTARWFASEGIAALAYDKRGTGGSTGDFRRVPFEDICVDGLAAVEYLKSRKEIDAKRIGVWGLSQGGWLGPLAASRSPDISWVIAVSGPGVSPGEQMIVYYAHGLREQGLPEKSIQEAGALRREIYEYLYSGKGYEQAKADLERASTKPWASAVKSQRDSIFDRLQPPSELNERDNPNIMRFAREMHYDPVPALERLHVPALFLFGDQDWMIPVEKSVEVIRRVLTESGRSDFTIQVFHNVDHGMHLTNAGSYDSQAPEYFATMHNWLAAHVHNSAVAPSGRN